LSGLILGIETATARGGVALVSGAGELVGETTLLSQEGHSERVLPALEQLLKLLGLTLRALAAVAVSSGPGSFTGLRTGIATAKGLAFSLGLPLYGIPTLEALAAGAPPGTGFVCACLNARRGEVYRSLFRAGPAGPVRVGPDAVVAAGEFAAELPAACLLVGELPPRWSERPASRNHSWLPSPALANHPRASAVALLGLEALRQGRPSELGSLQPRYVRPPDAVARRTVR
jgi:tRNA threonylcarbamoyladenosine biosynthesis protein TsaB